jgi:LysM repeat protein
MFAEKRLHYQLGSIFICFLIVMSSCVSARSTPSPPVASRIALTPYQSPTPSREPDHVTAVVVTPTDLPTLTPTPVTYTIVAGDTMLAIALRHGISLEDLQAANPDVNARLLSVGTKLIIPLGEYIPPSPMTATAVPVILSNTDCYEVPDGIWCFVLVKNDRSKDLENVSARLLLYGDSGELVAEGMSTAALNKLPTNEEIPLIVFFPGNFSGEFSAYTNVLTAQPIPKNDERYLNAWLEIQEVVISDEGLQAEVKGSFGIPAKSPPGNQTWIAVTAYDKKGKVVGVRKLEYLATLEPGRIREFSVEVFSLGPAIAKVNALIEVQP